jgi:hypothetical protein
MNEFIGLALIVFNCWIWWYSGYLDGQRAKSSVGSPDA